MPNSIEVKIMHRKKTGVFVIELPEYDMVTEADTTEDIDRMINDLMYELFEVPKEHQHKIRYITNKPQTLPQTVSQMVIQTTPDIYGQTYAC